MGFRSRALLTGVATGFLRANNKRHDEMKQRLTQLADTNAEIERERAKSELTNAVKAASDESAKFKQLQDMGHIDAEGAFTPAYWRDVTQKDWQEHGNGKTHDEYIQVYKQDRPQKFVRAYKDVGEIQSGFQEVYRSINAKQVAESSINPLTPFEQMLGGGIATVFGGSSDIEQKAVQIDTPVVNPLTNNTPSPTYENKGLSYNMPQEKPETISQIVTGANGEMYAVFASNKGEPIKQKLNIRARVGDENSKGGFGTMGTEKVRLFNPADNTYFAENTHLDVATGNVRVGKDWVEVPEGLISVPQDVKIDKIEFPDPNTGDVMTVQAYQTATGTVGPNVITMPDGTAWSTVTKPVPKVDSEGKPIQTKKIPPVIKTNLDEFNRQHKTITLVDALVRSNYVSNPVSWAQKNLSVVADTVAASFGYQGDAEGQLDAVVAYANRQLTEAGLKDKIGALDTAAVRAGEKDAIQALLTFAMADSQKSGDRLSNQDVENAREVVSPLVSGTMSHRSAVLAVRNLAEKRVATVVAQDLSLAQGQGPTSEIWDYYPSSKAQVAKGLTPIAEAFDGEQLVYKIKALEKTNPQAYANTIKHLTANKGLGNKWEYALTQPVRVDTKTGTVFLPFYQESSDGTIRVGIFKAK